ncbi:hypothetical protein LOZ80_14470 [Paenibacillus sp. HWE-109]|uniref:hypothetical protein n=1 Tax=Paenibacillus sp. HWE-109 TaxID=1306526 RepID=UPI001EDE4B88|nr:hypothetical protein [Paenibacillus sp. HWE-109]UKS30068.1 hypothetical protein LOZ80_14470 [Paenibacillus sp. HWE-109]
MKFKKITLVLAAVSALAFGAQSAFANTNINEQFDVQNNSFNTPEAFLAGAPAGTTNPFGYNKVGSLSNPNDIDWYLLTFPQNTSYPGATATISLVSPYGGPQYGVTIVDENGGYIEKTRVTDTEQLTQYTINYNPNIKYKVSVYSLSSNVSPYNYQLAIN